MEKKKYRHELKHYINESDWMALRSRLQIIAKPDQNVGENGSYRIRSLYFDNYRDKAVFEKLSGVSDREKFRIRYYGDNLDFIRLEKKSKKERYVNKTQAQITAEECAQLLSGNLDALIENGRPLCMDLYEKMQTQILRPKTIVDYDREAYVYGPGNVRITVDYNIRMSNNVTDFLDPHCITIPAARAIILEVKFDAFLPDIIRDIIQIGNRNETEFSKYVVSRLVI